jgi:hypothetical protein
MPEKKFALEDGEAKRMRVVSNLFSSHYSGVINTSLEMRERLLHA